MTDKLFNDKTAEVFDLHKQQLINLQTASTTEISNILFIDLLEWYPYIIHIISIQRNLLLPYFYVKDQPFHYNPKNLTF